MMSHDLIVILPDDVIMNDNDRSVPIVTRTEHQLYEDKQEVSHISLELPTNLASNLSLVS